MALKIEDGGGQGVLAKVTSEGRLSTRSDVIPIIQHESAVHGFTASFASTFVTGGTGIEVLSIKNTEASLRFFVEGFWASSTVTQVWTLFEVTSGTAAGTTLTPENLNLASGVAPANTSFGNAAVTGTLAGDTLFIGQTIANTPQYFSFQGSILLGTNDEIALTASANGTVYVTLIGFWDD